MNHNWPGNVRELENLMQNAAVMSRSDYIEPDDLSLVSEADHTESIPADWSGLTHDEAMTRAEKALLEDALQRASGNRSKAAEKPGLYRQRFYAKLRLHNLL